MLYRGRVAGVWTIEKGTIDVTAFEPIPQDLLTAEIERHRSPS